ncbi:MAG: hypothetical protein IPG07_07520 [Crocinitomicaceae bacterium]|nr:hypothetical protein [Crocinitomicaceae bacterium]
MRAGLAAGFSDDDYDDAGAVIIQSRKEILEASDIILCFDQLPEMTWSMTKKK